MTSAPRRTTPRAPASAALTPLLILAAGCTEPGASGDGTPPAEATDPARVSAEVEAAVWAFHRADTARDAEAVIGLLWPDFQMLGDGARQDYAGVVDASREFMGSLELFHTEWSDVRIIPLGPDAAVASFQFRDSIVTTTGELIRTRGPTTFVWQRRGGVWRVLFADSDHYPIER